MEGLVRLTKRKKTLITTLVLLVLVPALSYFTFKDSLKLGIEGNSWLLLYTIRMIFDVQKSLTFTDPGTYLCTYCPPYTILSIIKFFWGYQPYYYFLISLLTRIGISISLYISVKHISKSTLAGVLASIFFAANYIGVQTTEWVFNHNHYLGIVFVALFMLWYVKTMEKQTVKNLVIASFFFLGGLIITPPRMHGVFPMLLIAEFAWLLIDRKKYSFKKAAIRLGFILILYRMLFGLAQGGYGTSLFPSMIYKSLEIMLSSWKNGQTTFVLNPVISLGNYVFPDLLWKRITLNSTEIFGLPFTFTNLTLAVMLIISPLTAKVLRLAELSYKNIVIYLASLGVWVFLLRLFRKANPTTFSNEHATYALVGGITIIFTVWLFFALKNKKPRFAHTLIVGLAWMFTFGLFPWLLSPTTYLVSWARYSIQQAVGLSVWAATLFAIIISFSHKKKTTIKYFPNLTLLASAVLILTFIIMHVSFTRSHMTILAKHRNAELDERLWSTIYAEVPKLDPSGPSVFYLTYDNYNTAEWVLRFGFNSRAAILYEIDNQKAIPHMTYDYDDLLSLVSDGEALAKYKMYPKIIPVKRVYAFDLKNGNLTNTTQSIRNKLKHDLAD